MEDQGNFKDDENLFKQFCTGCKKSLEKLYEVYISIEKNVLKNSGNTQDAEDIYRYGLLTLLKYCQKEAPQPRPKALLYGICHKAWLKELEKRKREKVTFAEFKEYRDEDKTKEDVEDLLTHRRSLLWKHVLLLPKKGQELYNYYYRKGWSLKEIAKEMGYADEKSAKTQKAKLIKKLREDVRQDPNYK